MTGIATPDPATSPRATANPATDASPCGPAASWMLEGRNLRRNFGALVATDSVSITVAPGEIHGLIGPNGAGKSTLIHLLAGTLRPQSGSLWLDGTEITGLPANQRAGAGLARSFQITNTFRDLSVLNNLLLAAQASDGSSFRFWRSRDENHALHERALALAQTCAIDAAVLPQLAGTLPHGEQRKLEFALALASNPKVLLLDEPMAGMGPDETQRLTDLIESLRGKHAMLLVEHDMDVVFRLADRISVLVSGRIIASGSPQEIRSNPAVIQAYLGDDETTAAVSAQEQA